jgi:putative RNA 2'-phosphotransferase
MDYIRLSKAISYALRHAPWEYDLELDEHGWASIEQLLSSLRRKKRWPELQVSAGKIRALYGHSTPQ